MDLKMKNVAIIVGAGKGKRMGLKDKTFLKLNKKPILFHTVLPFERSLVVDEIILVVGKDRIEKTKRIIKSHGFKKIKKIVPGGKERQDSVYNAIKIIDNSDYILVQDMARPLVNINLIDKCIRGAKENGSAIPAVLSKDTVKIGQEFVQRTIPRENIWMIQTPQVFRFNILKDAYEKAKKDKFYGTDDSSLVERIGKRVKIIPSFYENIKITVPADILIAEKLIKKRKLQ